MSVFMKYRSAFFIILSGFILICSCEETDQVTPTSGQHYMSIAGGNNQVERTGAGLPEPMLVKVTSLTGQPVSGVAVEFSTEDSAAVVTTIRGVTGSAGTASCRFRLGEKPGEQHVSAVSRNDSVSFTATAEEPGCTEESIEPAAGWDEQNVYITTTSSTLIGAGMNSVLIEFDPETETAAKVLDTDEELIDLAFSARGELFVATDTEIFKVDPATLQLESYTSTAASGTGEVEITGNPGGVLLGINGDQLFTVFCPADGIAETSLPSYPLSFQNLATDADTRNAYYLHVTQTFVELHRMSWGGRDISNAAFETLAGMSVADASPAGMAVDSTGAVYITIDGDGSQREIVRYDPGDDSMSVIFDFFDYFGGNNSTSGRWGDLTVSGGIIYIIDRRNDRIAYISVEGDYLGASVSTAFSYSGLENERYGIASIR